MSFKTFILPVIIIFTIYFAVLLLSSIFLLFHTNREFPRKFIHCFVGVVSIVHYFIFQNIYQSLTVGILGLISIIIFRFIKPDFYLFQASRKTLGDIFFIIGIGIPLLLSRSDLYIGISALLVLSISDPLACLLRSRRINRFSIIFNKTVRGSAMFFISCFTILILVYMQSGDIYNMILPLLIISLITTLGEFLSTKGFDNITIPFCIFSLLYILKTSNRYFYLISFILLILLTIIPAVKYSRLREKYVR